MLNIALSLVTTPALLHYLGLTTYGAMAVIGSLTAYFGLLDFGIGAGLGRYMTFYQERDDTVGVARVTTFGLMFYLVMAAILFPALIGAAPRIGTMLSLPPDVRRQLPGLIAVLVALFIANSINGLLVARLASIHRLDIAAFVGMCGSIVYTAAVLSVVAFYPSLYAVFACSAAQIVVSAVIMAVAIRRLTGASPLLLARPEWIHVRELFSFGIWSQISSLTAVINLEADKAIISGYLGLVSVTPYQVASRLALMNRMLPLQLISSMLPEVTAQFSRGMSHVDMEETYRRSSRFLMLTTMFISGFVGAGAASLLRFWLGTDIPGAAGLCAALVASYAVNNLTGVGTTIVKAQGQPQLETYYGVVSAVINVALTVVLIGRFGLYGVIAGTIAGNVIGSILFMVMFHYSRHLAWWATIGSWLVRLSAMTLVSGILANLVLRWIEAPGMNRLEMVPGLAISGSVYTLAFIGTGIVFGFWTDEDQLLWHRLTRPFSGKRRASQ